MKKTQLRRGTSQLKRTPLKKVSLNKKTYSKKRMIYGIKVWSLTKADTEYSRWIREQKDYTCEMCGFKDIPPTRLIQCSHYIGRSHKAIRFDPQNTDVFCASCHYAMEDLKQYDYREWKISRMGEEAHSNLLIKARNSFGEKDSILNCMRLLGKIN
jgi:hypothetical protein